MKHPSSALVPLLLAMLAACAGSSGDEGGPSTTPKVDTRDDAGSHVVPDAGPAVPARPSNAHCDIDRPLASLDAIRGEGDLNLTAGAITLSADELTIFTQRRGGGLQSASRDSVTAGFAAPTAAGYGNGRYIGSFSLTRDGLALYSTFSVAYDDGTISDELFLYVARRDSTSANFGAGTKLNEFGAHVVEPYVAADGDVVYFVKNQDLYQSKRGSSGFMDATAIEELSTDEPELTPVISGDGLTLFFKRGARSGGGLAFHLWAAYRESKDAPFEAPTKLAQLADPDDNPKWASEDGCTLYLERRTEGRLGLWRARFAP